MAINKVMHMITFSIPVIYKRGKADLGTRVLLPLNELLYLRVFGKSICFYGIHRKEYVLQASLADWRILLDGLPFDEVDRGVLVNVDNVAYGYTDLQQLHFGPNAEGVFCLIAGAHIQRFQRQYPHVPFRQSGNLMS
jgi:hypothetical protein